MENHRLNKVTQCLLSHRLIFADATGMTRSSLAQPAELLDSSLVAEKTRRVSLLPGSQMTLLTRTETSHHCHTTTFPAFQEGAKNLDDLGM